MSGEEAVLWFILEDGRAIRLTDTYHSDFYVKVKAGYDIEDVGWTLKQHPNITDVKTEEKYVAIDARVKSTVLHVLTDSSTHFKSLLLDLQKLTAIENLFNTDLLHVQRYLYRKNLTPTSKVDVTWNSKEVLKSFKTLDDEDELAPPQFKVLHFELEIASKSFTANPEKDAVESIHCITDGREKTVLTGEEDSLLCEFSSQVQDENPDFLVAPRCREHALPYILRRAQILGVHIQLGRENLDLYAPHRYGLCATRGRVVVDEADFSEYGCAGIVERSRFTMAPPRLSATWPAGKTIDSRQCFEALKRDILIPKRRSFPKFSLTAKNLIFRDRGGLLLSPEAGLHENVAELDFESMFPHIIVSNNISYETVTPEFVDRRRHGLLGAFTKRFLERRLRFKHLRKVFQRGSREWCWCDQRQNALKGVLVCIYGFSGCFANRFGSVTVYEEINRVAREKLVKTLNICMSRGYQVVYGDTDSIFVKRSRARRRDYAELAKRIRSDVKLPIALDHHYKFIVFTKQKNQPGVNAAKRYFGKLTSGRLHYRGIGLRRHDCPVFIKNFQNNLLQILFNAETAEEVENKCFEDACSYVEESSRRLMNGEVDSEDLVISKLLWKPPEEYRSMLPHVIASRIMEHKGKVFDKFEPVRFVYASADHRNPMVRVISDYLMDENHRYYDRRKYVKLLLDAAEAVLNALEFKKEKANPEEKLDGYLKE